MKIAKYLNKPEYVFRPSQLCRRMLHSVKGSNNKFERVTLPWKIQINVRPNETIGRSIVTMGVYDLSVTEALWRLIDPSEITLDVGANVGYMTSLMAKRVGETGKVYAYEPHPEIYEELCENKRMWQETYGWYQIESQCVALSNTSGVGMLNIPPHFEENRGVASLLNDLNEQGDDNSYQYPVPLAKLDDLMNGGYPVAVIKLDVEGHELEVLQGGEKVITRYVRDIIFEEHGDYPSEVTYFLEDRGFTLFGLYKDIWGPRLELIAGKPRSRALPWEPPSYLATRNAERAMKRMERRGWQAISNS